MDRLGRRCFLRAFPLVLQRTNRPRDRPARPPDLPCIPAGEGVALRSGCSVARAARTSWRGRIYAGLETLWRLDRFWSDAGLFAGDLLWCGGAGTDALGRDSFLGFALSGSTGPDDRLRLRHAQFLHLL